MIWRQLSHSSSFLRPKYRAGGLKQEVSNLIEQKVRRNLPSELTVKPVCLDYVAHKVRHLALWSFDPTHIKGLTYQNTGPRRSIGLGVACPRARAVLAEEEALRFDRF